MFNQGKQLSWGIVTLPSFKEAPGKGYAPDIALLMITPASKHKQEAFQVLSLLTSQEAQIEMGKGGRLSSLKDAKARESFGQNLKSLKGVDVKAIVEYSPSPEPPYSKYSDLATKQINPALNKALSGATDINTALRDAEELANQAIAAELQGNGGK
jgi:multiple sugar transport system substrate-binding protein